MRKICVITGTRAEYGLLYWLMKEIKQDDELELQLVVTGMHLSPEFGLTYKEIAKEFKINKKIEMLLSSDTPVGISKSMGLAQISFSEAYDDLNPDMVVLLGDRYEIFSAASAAMIARIPIVHLHGGETTEGAFDESIRHAITKMSHLHFAATETYRQRIIQLGESPSRVFNVGGLGIENIKRLPLLSRKVLEKEIGFNLGEKNILVTFHPVSLEASTSKIQFMALLDVIDSFQNTHVIFTKANSDTDGRIINQMIDDYVLSHENTIAFTSMGQLRYLSALQFMDAVIGNSSSGLIEAPSFGTTTINIGDRQKGRLKATSVIDCKPEKHSIQKAFEKCASSNHRNIINPYGDGCSSKRIISILKDYNMSNILKKQFYDINLTDSSCGK